GFHRREAFLQFFILPHELVDALVHTARHRRFFILRWFLWLFRSAFHLLIAGRWCLLFHYSVFLLVPGSLIDLLDVIGRACHCYIIAHSNLLSAALPPAIPVPGLPLVPASLPRGPVALPACLLRAPVGPSASLVHGHYRAIPSIRLAPSWPVQSLSAPLSLFPLPQSWSGCLGRQS